MTLEEAIAHHEWAAENSEGEVSREHKRYVSWLTQLQLARENMFSVEIPQMAQTIYENHRLQEENAKLRELARMLINCADSISGEDVYYERDVDGCGFDCVVNGENCSFAKMCDRACKLGVEVDG